MVGAAFILTDPIFNGLAISLIFGLAVSTLLTVVLVPLLYYVFIGDREVAGLPRGVDGFDAVRLMSLEDVRLIAAIDDSQVSVPGRNPVESTI